jgi:uncharacterized protein (DUF58 family)
VTSSFKKKAVTESAGVILNKFGLLVITALLILAAWMGQPVIVIFLGLALAVGLISRAWSFLSLKKVSAERRLSNNRAFPGEYIEMKMRLENRKILPLPWVQITSEVPVGFARDARPASSEKPGFVSLSHFTSLPWYSAENWKYSLCCQKRGYYPLGPLRISSGDIFGLYPCTAEEGGADHIIVYPRIYPLNNPGISSLYPLGEAKAEKRLFEDPARSAGVRGYRPGDSLRRIHWKSSARHQGLQVKLYESTTTLKAGIFLAADSFIDEAGCRLTDHLELGICTAASLASYLIEARSQAGLWVNAKLADTGQPARVPPSAGVSQLAEILECLAKATAETSQPFMEYFQNERKSLPLGISLIFIFSRVSNEIKGLLADLAGSGYKTVVFQIGEAESREAVPDTVWNYIRQAGDLAEARFGERG